MSLELSGTTPAIKGVAGSVSAPAITGDDADTGISFPAADTIKFSTGGVERMAISNSGVSGITAGITMADQWYLTATFTGNTDPVQNNLSRFTTAGNLGSAMTVSSGIWTFPSTGFYKIDVSAQVYRASGNQNAYAQWRTILSTDNFSSNFVGAIADAGWFDNYNATRFGGGSSSVVFDVTNVSTHKLKFKTVVEDNCTWGGDATVPATMFNFVRLGDT